MHFLSASPTGARFGSGSRPLVVFRWSLGWMPPILKKWTCLDQASASLGWVWLEAFCLYPWRPWDLERSGLPGLPRSPQLLVGLGGCVRPARPHSVQGLGPYNLLNQLYAVNSKSQAQTMNSSHEHEGNIGNIEVYKNQGSLRGSFWETPCLSIV